MADDSSSTDCSIQKCTGEEIMLEPASQDAMFLKLFEDRVKGEEKSSEGWVAVLFFFLLESLLTIL